jgi:glycosyltransferase involved in cell wall biosynthesis
MKLSAVINTRNETKNIVRCLKSIAEYVNEIVVVDMQSSDDTVKLAKEYTANIFHHENTNYVEPARNFAISKATGDWILILDADEVLPEMLGVKLKKLAEYGEFSFYRFPRKNWIFGKWIKYSGWWPDYQIRFFKKDKVTWDNEIHSIPITQGKGMDLIAEEKNALIHYHYENLEQYLDRLNRYTTVESNAKVANNYQFKWENVITKPANEFISRFFAWKGYKDGLHGLALSLLQAFSLMVVELKVWQLEKFNDINPPQFLPQTGKLFRQKRKDFCFWYFGERAKSSKGILKHWFKLLSRIPL